MKSKNTAKGVLPKLSTSFMAVSLLLLVACNDSTATAEQAPKEILAAVEKVVEKTSPATSLEQDAKIILAEATTSKETTKEVNETKEAPKPAKTNFIEGQHYFEIFPAINVDAPKGKVEVIELMWLSCPHCYHLEEDIVHYEKNKPSYVDFKQIPAMLNPVWSKDAETYYIADFMDPTGEKKIISKLFHAIHEQGRRLKSEDSVKRFFEQLGVSAEDYNKVKNSMAYKAKLNRARQVSAGSQISSVPAILINGKYRTSAYAAGGEKKLFELVKMLTEKEKNRMTK